MKRLGFILAVLAITGAAHSADLPLPPFSPSRSWTGVYVGANGGYGWANTNWSFPQTQFFADVGGQNFSTSPAGGMAGGQIGINKQSGNWVFGVEFTGDWANLTETLVGPVSPTFPADAWATKVHDVEKLTGRIGYAMNNWLFYGKAGGATGSVNLHAFSGLPVSDLLFDNTQRLWGATVGAGIEYAWTSNIILGAEYDYTRLSNGSFNGTGVCTAAASCVTDNGDAVNVGGNSAVQVQSVLGRISYKLGLGS